MRLLTAQIVRGEFSQGFESLDHRVKASAVADVFFARASVLLKIQFTKLAHSRCLFR